MRKAPRRKEFKGARVVVPTRVYTSKPPSLATQDQNAGEDFYHHDWLEKHRNILMPEAARVKVYRDYVRGRQKVTLSKKQKKLLNAGLGHRFVDNLCLKAISVLTSRMRLARFMVDTGNESSSSEAEKRLGELLTTHNLHDLNNNTLWAMMRDGDCYITVQWVSEPTATDPNAGRLVFARELCFDGETGAILFYDRNNRPGAFLKDWRESDGSLRRDLYYDDRIYRWRKPALAEGARAPLGPRGWLRYSEPTDPINEVDTADGVFFEPLWPVPWLTPEGKPIGLPFVHFRNPHIPNDGTANAYDPDDELVPDGMALRTETAFDPRYGVSMFATGLLGIQDDLNRAYNELSISRRFTAFQQYWSAADPPDEDDADDDNEDGEARLAIPGTWHEFDDKDAKVGVLPAGDPTPIIKSIDTLLAAFSRNSEVPIHAFTGDWPSGVAMYQAESALHFKVERITDSIGPRWGHVGHWAMVGLSTFAKETLPLDVPVGMEFDSVSRLDPITMAEVAKAIAPYVSNREVLRKLYYTQQQIEQIEAERAAERQATIDHETQLADIAVRNFNRGPQPGGNNAE